MGEISQNPQGAPRQSDFRDVPYEDATWPIVGEVPEVLEFRPMELEHLTHEELAADPLFADYSGELPTGDRRWHLPEHLALAGVMKRGEAEEVDPRVKLTEAEIEAIRSEAYERGKQEALDLAAAARVAEISQIEGRLSQILKDLEGQIKEQFVLIETQAVELSISISKKIIDTAVEINPEYIRGIIENALARVGTARIQKVRVSPEDYESVRVLGIPQRIKEYDGTWEFEADETIRAGCVVETSAGQVDFQLDPAWERVRDQVVKLMR